MAGAAWRLAAIVSAAGITPWRLMVSTHGLANCTAKFVCRLGAGAPIDWLGAGGPGARCAGR